MAANSFMSIWIILLCLLPIQGYVNSACMNSSCHCSAYTMVCAHGQVPTYVPAGIIELTLEHFNFENGIQLKTMSGIQKLDIQADFGSEIPAENFQSFPNLTYLGLHGHELRAIHKDTFLGLEFIVSLDFSASRFLEASDVSIALNAENRKLLPNLETLSIAKIKTALPEPVDLDKYFFRSITSGRKLKYLDLSELNIYKLDFEDLRLLCGSVEAVYLRKSVISRYDHFIWADPCTTLKTIDLSESVFPNLRFENSLTELNFGCDIEYFYNIENFYAKRVNTVLDIEINNYTLNMSVCPFHFRKIDMSFNKIKWVNMTVRLHEATRVSDLNLSYNGLEYVSSSVIKPSEIIEILDLSNNRLSVMQENYRADFEVLFWAMSNLLSLNLSHNSLSEIPKKVFSKNKLLKLLDISFNNVKAIDFSIVQLLNLEQLFASHNRIHTITENFRNGIQSLLERIPDNGTGDGMNSLRVYLKDNLFTCTCDKNNLKLLDWLHSTTALEESELITCDIDGDVVNIRDNALENTKHFCKMQIVKTVAAISAPLVVVTVIFSVLAVVVFKKRRRKRQQIRAIIDQIEMGLFHLPYLAFLSYCSEDTDLVMGKIYPQLCNHLSEITHSDKELVCCGDMHFRPGFAVRYEVMRCIEESSVVIAVISKDFCRKHWCNLEIGWAFDQNKPIILLMLEHVEKDLMDRFLQKIFDRYTHARWVPDENGGHVEPEWNIFCTSIIDLAGKGDRERRQNDHNYLERQGRREF